MDSNDDKDKHTGGLVAIILLAMPILYVLLLGPIAWLYQRFPQAPFQEAARTAYMPLKWLDEKLPGQPFSEYVELWE